MSREELQRSGILDQYVLGLLDPERAAEVEQLLERDPTLMQDVDRLRQDLNSYADARNIAPPADGRPLRTAEDFQDLDHEMITAMMERNHTLNIWRYVLITACLLLVGLGGYLFRIKENLRGELITERALHAQDEASYQQDLARGRTAIQTAVGNWENLRSIEQATDTGVLHVHLLPGAGVVLLDLSDLAVLDTGEAYYIFGGRTGSPPEVVTARQQGGLSVVKLGDAPGHLRIYRRPVDQGAPPVATEHPLATVELPAAD